MTEWVGSNLSTLKFSPLCLDATQSSERALTLLLKPSILASISQKRKSGSEVGTDMIFHPQKYFQFMRAVLAYAKMCNTLVVRARVHELWLFKHHVTPRTVPYAVRLTG